MTARTSPTMHLLRRLILSVLSVSVSILCLSGVNAEEITGSDDLADLSLDELLSTEITTLSGESGEYRISRSLVPPYETIANTFTDISGGFLVANWSHDFSEDSELQIRAYYDAHERDVPTYTEDSETSDPEAFLELPWNF